MNIALVAHDARKKDAIEWALKHINKLKNHTIWCTATTGKKLAESTSDLSLKIVRSGPLGGDQEIGVKIASGEIDFIIFLVDGLSIQPHDSDIKALIRLAVIYNIPIALNRSSAELIISSSTLEDKTFLPEKNDFSDYINRKI